MANSRLMRLDDEIVPGLATHHQQQPEAASRRAAGACLSPAKAAPSRMSTTC